MADIMGLMKKFGLKNEANETGDDVSKYGKNLKEFAMLESLDKEYDEAREEVRETQYKLKEVEETIISIENEKKEKMQLSEQLYIEGRSFYDSGDYNRAIERWHHVLEIYPQHKRSMAAIQDSKEHLHREELERRERQRAAEKKSHESNEHFEIGKKYYREKNYEQALEEFEIALNIGGRNPQVIENKMLTEQRIREREEHIDQDKKKKEEQERLIKEHCLVANNFYRQEKYEDALTEWERALLIDPESKVLQEYVKRAQGAHREYKKRMAEKAREAEEKLRRIREFQLQGLRYSRENDFEKAIACWEQAVAVDSSREDIYLDIKSAQKSLEEIARIRRENEEKEKERLRKEQEHERLRAEETEKLKREKEEHEREYLRKERERERLLAEEAEKLKLEKEEQEREFLRKDQERERRLREENEKYQRELEERERERIRHEDEIKRKKEEEQYQREEEEKKARLEKMKVHYGRGLRFFKLQEYEKALSEWEIVVSLDAHFENITELIDQTGRRIDELEKEKRERKSIAEEEQRKVLEEERKRDIERENRIRLFFNEGLQLSYSGEYEKALEKLYQSLSLNRNDEGIRREISIVEMKMQEKQKKEDEERIRLEEKKGEDERKRLKVRLISEQAQMYFEDSDYQRAVEEWRKILEMDFSNQDARSWIYKAERAIKDAKRKMIAEEHSRKERREKFNRLNFEAAELFNDGHYEEAIRLWSEVFDMEPVNSESKQGIIKAKQRMKEIENREKARNTVKKLLHEQEMQMGHLKSLIEKGERFYISGEYKQALSEWERAFGELKK